MGGIIWRTDPKKALQIYDHALSRIAEAKNNTKARRGEAQLLALSSYPLRRLNRNPEARQRIERAFQLVRETKDYPAKSIVLDDEVATIVSASADDLVGQLPLARDTYRELLEKVGGPAQSRR